MKKRLISFLLAVSMMLSLVPVGAVAATAVQNLTISETTHRPTTSGGGSSGWRYDEGTDTLTIEKGYIMADNVSYPYIACKVVNRGTIKGAIYTNNVTSENGSFLFGIYKSKPTGTFASGSKEFHTISSSDGTAFGLNSKLYNIKEAYSVKEQRVTVNAPEGKVVSEITGASIGWGGVSGIDTDTATFTMAEQNVTITFVSKPGYTEPTTKIPLVIEDNGYPKGTENGTKDVYNGDGWSFQTTTLANGNNEKALVLNKEFDLTGKILNVPVVVNGVSITGGTFKGSVTTTGDVRGGLFLGDFTSANAPTGGIFAQRNNTALKLRKVSIQDGSPFTIPVNGVDHEFTEVYIPDQTTITLTAAIALARMNGTDIPAAQLSNDGKTVMITANSEDIVLDKALTPPTKDLFNVYVQDVTYDGDPHAAAVRAKTAAELTDVPAGPITADFTVKYRLVGGSSAFTTTEPTNAGTYEVAVSFPAAGNYEGAEDLVLGQFTIGKKTITAEDFTFSAPANLTYDGTAKAATVRPADEYNPVATSFTVQYTDAAGEAVDEPTNAGTYNVMLAITPDSNHKLTDDSLLGNADWTFEIAKADLTANDFEMVGEGENRTIQPKDGHDGVTVGEVKWMPVESIATLSLDLDEMDSGTYQAYITVRAEENSNYKAPDGQLTDGSWTFSIGKRDLTAADFTIKTPTYPDDHFDGSPKEVQPTYKGAVAIGEITVTYWKQNDASEWVAIEGAPVETGTYRFTLDVAESPNNNPATGLRGDDWQFTIAEPLYHVYVEGGRAYYFDATDTRKDIDDETLVPAKVTVHLVADTDETADTDTEITLLTLDAEDEGTVDDFQWYIDPRTGSNLTEIANPTSRTDASFVMPRGDVYITTTNPNPEPEIVDSGAGTAVAVVLGGAAIGGVAYLAGTQLYLESVLPKGAAIPVNRQQLADLLWTTAGKPQPQNSVLFTDISAEAIDSQKAARWCVEQGLMQADDTSFKPSRHTFRLQVIKAWNDLQAMQKAG